MLSDLTDSLRIGLAVKPVGLDSTEGLKTLLWTQCLFLGLCRPPDVPRVPRAGGGRGGTSREKAKMKPARKNQDRVHPYHRNKL